MKLVIRNFLEMKLIFNEIHHSKFYKNKTYYSKTKELRNDLIDENNQGYHHHKNDAKE